MTSLFQIWYKEEHRSKLLPFAIPVYNPTLTIFFENKLISELVPTSKSEYTGVVSWKLADKMRKIHREKLPSALNGGFHVMSLTKNSQRHSMLAAANVWHPYFLKTITLLWSKLGLQIPKEARHPIYQNAFLSRTDIYQDYVTNFLNPAMKLIEEDETLHNLMIQPSGYSKLNRSADIRSVKSKLGMDDYPLAPFILERCPSLFFTLKNIPVTYL